MLFFGHRFIKSEPFYVVYKPQLLTKTPPNSTIYLEFSEDHLGMVDYLQANGISFVLGAKTIEELIYAQALGASYIVVDAAIAADAKSIADEYLFDAKVLVRIYSDNEIERYAKLGIDGVVYPQAFIEPTG